MPARDAKPRRTVPKPVQSIAPERLRTIRRTIKRLAATQAGEQVLKQGMAPGRTPQAKSSGR